MQVRSLSFITLFLLIAIPLTTASASYDDFVKKGDDFFADGEYPSALDAYDAAIDLDDTQADLYEKKARSLFELNRYKEALSAIKKSLAISDSSSTALSLKSDIEKKLGISDESEPQTDKKSDGSGDSGSGTTVNEDGSVTLNLDDYQLFNALYLKDGEKEYLTFVPVENECEWLEDSELYLCSSPYSEYYFKVEHFSPEAYIPGKEKEFLAQRLDAIIEGVSMTVDRESYNNKFTYYRVEGYSADDENYWVAVHRLIDNIVVSFHFLYANQEMSDADQDIQKYMIESLKRYEREVVDSSDSSGTSGGGGGSL